MEGPARLYRNHGDGTFVDVAPELGVVGPPHGFTCMFWDYDDDGRLDIFVADYSSNLSEVVADELHPLAARPVIEGRRDGGRRQPPFAPFAPLGMLQGGTTLLARA